MNFDRIAGFYDELAALIFGKTWKKIQLAPVACLNRHKNVLIVGGGTGTILPHLDQEMCLTYVELSEKMIRTAQKRDHPTQIEFVHEDFVTWSPDTRYDAILMPFFLDCFDEDKLRIVIEKTRELLRPRGQLHVIEFHRSSELKNLLVKVMYLFFRMVTQMNGNRLLDVNSELLVSGFKLEKNVQFFESWIIHSIYSSEEQ